MAKKRTKLPRNIASRMRYYVYLYVDPKTKQVLYVGKGRGDRAFDHLPNSAEVEFLAHDLPDEETALCVEAAAIDLLGLEKLENNLRGHGCHERGRMTLGQILSRYQQKEAKITEPAIIIRIKKRYRYGMLASELYDATRSAWRVNPKRKHPDYAVAVFDGIVREVYKIEHWFPAGATFNTWYPKGKKRKNRYEFVGTVASDGIRRKYLGRSVSSYLKRHSQNPIQYVNCDAR